MINSCIIPIPIISIEIIYIIVYEEKKNIEFCYKVLEKWQSSETLKIYYELKYLKEWQSNFVYECVLWIRDLRIRIQRRKLQESPDGYYRLEKK